MKLWKESIMWIIIFGIGSLIWLSGVQNGLERCIGCQDDLIQTKSKLKISLKNQFDFNDNLNNALNSAHEKVVAEAVEK